MKRNFSKKGMMSLVLVSTVMGCVGASAADIQEFTLDSMVVTATRYEADPLTIPATTEVFSREKIEAMGARTVMEVMQNIPGFTISESPSGNGSPGLRHIHGHLGILINGVPLASEGYFQMGTLSASGIERIEVVKGGSAIMYGSNATNGVINIITRKDAQSSITVGAGNNGQRDIGGYAGNDKFSVSYDWYREKDAGLVYKSSTSYYRDYLVRRSVNVQASPNEHWNFMYMWADKDNTCSKRVGTNPVSGYWQNVTKNTMAQATYKNNDLKATVYYQNREWWQESRPGSSGDQKGNYYGVDINNKWDFGKTNLTVGAVYDAERNKRSSAKGWVHNNRDHGAIFFVADTAVTNSTNVIVGARQVISDESSENVFCPQFQVLHKITKDSSVYVNLNKSLREPDLAQKYGYSETQDPNPDLKSEKGWTYEAGYKHRLDQNSMLKVDFYHMKISDRINKPTGSRMYINSLKYRSTGVEVSYDYTVPKGLSYGVGISYGNPEEIAKVGDSWSRMQNRLGAHAELSYKIGKFTASSFLNYAGERYSGETHLISVDGSMKYDLTKNDSVSFKMGNILNRADARTNGGGSMLPERHWMLSYTKKF